MAPKPWLNVLCLTALPLFVLMIGYFLFTNNYIFALVSLVGVMVSVRTRVHMGYRGPRQMLFAMHIATNVAFLLALALLILKVKALWLLPLSHVSFVGMVLTGGFLVTQSWKAPIPRATPVEA